MALDVRGKVALITGAGSGICLAVSQALLSAGCRILAFDLVLRDEATAIFTKATPANVEFVKGDVTDWAQLQHAFDHAIAHFGRLDIVIPGAGLAEPIWSNFWRFNSGVDDVASNHFKTLEVNVTHPIRATQLAIDSFVRQKHGHGVVVIISSIVAQIPVFPAPMYSASKHAMSGFTRSLAPLEPMRNIRVNAVAPGVVKTPLWTEDKSYWVQEDVDSWVPVSKIVDAILDLISKEEYVGGTVLEVGTDLTRPVAPFNDPGPVGRGFTLQGMSTAFGEVNGLLDTSFGK